MADPQILPNVEDAVPAFPNLGELLVVKSPTKVPTDQEVATAKDPLELAQTPTSETATPVDSSNASNKPVIKDSSPDKPGKEKSPKKTAKDKSPKKPKKDKSPKKPAKDKSPKKAGKDTSPPKPEPKRYVNDAQKGYIIFLG